MITKFRLFDLKTYESNYNPNFNIGDKVCCISTDGIILLEINKIYTVCDIDIDSTYGVFIKLEELIKHDHNYAQFRFRLATPEESEEYEMKKNINKYNL